ncbi:MAG: hypothetical protein LC739_12110 [Actinobacteria bacterium]|nr:hypothetical protein [Actinomycetota bacterium]
MRRWSLVFLLLAACIGQTSPDRTPLPDAASIIPEPEECQFLIGAGQGALIEDIVAGSGADGVLQVGDVLVSVNDDLDTPTENWVAAGARVLYLEGRDEEGSALIDMANEEQLVFEIGDWNGSNLLGSLGDQVIVAVTRPVPDNDEQVEVAVMLVDFAARNAEWLWQVTADSGIPIASYPSPTGSQILLIGEEPETGVLYHSLLSAEGTRTGSVEVPAGYVALGWFDEDRILVGGEGQGLQIVDLGGDAPVAVELPAVLTSLRRVWPVGDGTNVLGESGNALVRFSTDPAAEVRTLADNCQIDSLGDLGWSA